jgi:hypothetical protein
VVSVLLSRRDVRVNVDSGESCGGVNSVADDGFGWVVDDER